MAQGIINFNQSSITATSGSSTYVMSGSSSVVVSESMRAVSNDSWLSVTPLLTFIESETTSSQFVVNFAVEQNPSTSARTGTVTVRGVNPTNGHTEYNSFKVVQSAGSGIQPIIPEYKFEPTTTAVTFSGEQGNVYIRWATENIEKIQVGETSSGWGDWFYTSFYGAGDFCVVGVYQNTGSTRTGYFYLDAIGMNSEAVVKSVKITVTQEAQSNEAIITDVEDIHVDYNTYQGSVKTYFQNVTPSSVSWIGQGGSNFCTIQSSVTDNTVTVNYTIATNASDRSRWGNIVLNGTGNTSGDNLQKMISVHQDASPSVVAFPIWKDTDININSDNDYIYYRFYIDNKIAYSGKAYKINDEIVIRANDILKDYCAGSLQFDGGCTKSEDGYIQSELYVSDDDWLSSRIYCVCRAWSNWSYTNNNICSHPIEKEVDYRQYIVCSALAQKGESATSIEVVLPNRQTAVTYNIFESLSNVVIKASDVIDYGKITLKHKGIENTFDVICSKKHKYALYFRNVWGGYDWLLLNDASKRSDAVTSLSFIRKINNSTLNRSTVQYQKSITEKVALKTHILTDKQAELVGKAMRSVDCYLHNLEEDTIYPVNITDSTINYVNYVNNGRKMFNYTINVEIAQSRFSR